MSEITFEHKEGLSSYYQREYFRRLKEKDPILKGCAYKYALSHICYWADQIQQKTNNYAPIPLIKVSKELSYDYWLAAWHLLMPHKNYYNHFRKFYAYIWLELYDNTKLSKRDSALHAHAQLMRQYREGGVPFSKLNKHAASIENLFKTTNRPNKVCLYLFCKIPEKHFMYLCDTLHLQATGTRSIDKNMEKEIFDFCHNTGVYK